jgi:hypothetical protein
MAYAQKLDRAKEAAITLARAVNQQGTFFFLGHLITEFPM